MFEIYGIAALKAIYTMVVVQLRLCSRLRLLFSRYDQIFGNVMETDLRYLKLQNSHSTQVALRLHTERVYSFLPDFQNESGISKGTFAVRVGVGVGSR